MCIRHIGVRVPSPSDAENEKGQRMYVRQRMYGNACLCAKYTRAGRMRTLGIWAAAHVAFRSFTQTSVDPYTARCLPTYRLVWVHRNGAERDSQLGRHSNLMKTTQQETPARRCLQTRRLTQKDSSREEGCVNYDKMMKLLIQNICLYTDVMYAHCTVQRPRCMRRRLVYVGWQPH